MTNLEVRPFSDVDEYRSMIDYFVSGDDAFLRGMGVDPARLPPREAWLTRVLADHEKPYGERDRLYLAWIHDGVPIGHSSLNNIELGAQANIHLHMWKPERRRAGLGTELFRLSSNFAMDALGLKRLVCEPFADNPAPNRVLLKLGFTFVKRYLMTPGPFNFEQEVNRYELDHVIPPR